MKKLLIILCCVFFVGCAELQIDPCIQKYHAVAPQISLGDSKEEVCSALNPTQDGLPDRVKKPSETFVKDGTTIDIIYYRTGRMPDNMTTDDEFTPYIFENGKLVAIGWYALGGPKTRGRTPTRINVPQYQDNSGNELLEMQQQQHIWDMQRMQHDASFDRMMRGGLP